MKIDFYKLQKIFIEKIKNEEKIILKGHEVAFQIEPNIDFPNNSPTIRILVFKEHFGHGYANALCNETEYLADCFSRLHDYGTDSAKWHIWSLKIQQLEKSYAFQFDKIREMILDNMPELRPKDIDIQISDISDETDENGFPQFAVYLNFAEKSFEKIIDIYNHNYQLFEEFIEDFE